MSYKLYADGGCAPSNPGPGGFAFRLEAPDGTAIEGWGHEAPSTNNRMEILAATHGLRAVPAGAAVELICDSQYVLNGCSQWRRGWESRGMRKADGEPVLNADLWLALWAEADQRQVKCTWVKGHTGNPGNERVDELAGQARARKETNLPVAATTAQPHPRPAAAPSAPSAPVAGASPVAGPPAVAAGSASAAETLLMSLLSAKFGPQLRHDAVPAYKDIAGSILALLTRANWTPRG